MSLRSRPLALGVEQLGKAGGANRLHGSEWHGGLGGIIYHRGFPPVFCRDEDREYHGLGPLVDIYYALVRMLVTTLATLEMLALVQARNNVGEWLTPSLFPMLINLFWLRKLENSGSNEDVAVFFE